MHVSSGAYRLAAVIGIGLMGLLGGASVSTSAPLPPVFAPNATLDAFTCAAPSIVAYTPAEGPVTSDCTIEVTLSGLLVPVASFDVHIEVVAYDPAPHSSVAGPEFDSRVVGIPRLTTVTGNGTYTLDETVQLGDVDAVTGEAMGEWLAQQFASDRTLGFRVVLDPDDTFLEVPPGDSDNALFDAPLDHFRLTPLAGILGFGPFQTNLLTGWVEESPICPAGQFELAVGAIAQLDNPGWPLVSLPVGGSCVAFGTTSPDGAILQSTQTIGMFLTSNLSGIPVAALVDLTPFGAELLDAQIELPVGTTHHEASSSGEPSRVGHRTLKLISFGFGTTSGYGSDLNQIRGRLDPGLIHSNSLPFYLIASSLGFSEAGVRGYHQGIRYVYDLNFAAEDPRAPIAGSSLPRVASNDVRFGRSAADQTRPQFGIRGTGLYGQVTLGADEGRTHFPQGGVEWTLHELYLANGRIRPGQTLPPDIGFAFAMNTSCAECPNDAAEYQATVVSPLTGTSVATTGATMSRVGGLMNPTWGPSFNGGDFVFERTGDSTSAGILTVPGHVFPGTGGAENAPVVNALLGSHTATEPSPGALEIGSLNNRTSGPVRAGNGFFAGVTLGPEQLVGAMGLPDVGVGETLTGNATSIWFGGAGQPGPCDGQGCAFPDNAGSKYVVRSSGITGVFNTDDVDTPTVYGYDLPLTRFAFRMVENAIDSTTWMDGEVSIPLPGGFDVEFVSLTFDCTGDVSDGIVPPCTPELLPDGGNCGEVMGEWRTAMAPLTLGFAPVAADPACGGGDRVLSVGKSLALGALDDPLGLTATWEPTGSPIDALVTGENDHVLDRPAAPASPAENFGWNVVLEGPVELALDPTLGGSYLFDAAAAAPFWNALSLDLRLAQLAVDEPAPSVLVQRGSVANLEAVDPESAGLALMNSEPSAARAKYTWGASGFEFDLPVGYQGTAGSTVGPTFTGLTKSRSLVVMNLDAAVDYVTPQRTTVSFGASADLTARALAGIDLHIDLEDPESIARIDDWLNTFGISGDPIADAVGFITVEMAGLADLFSVPALEALLAAEIEGTLRGALNAAIVAPAPFGDAFEYAQSLFATIASLPAQFAAALSETLFEVAVEMTASLTPELDDVVLDIYAEASVALATKSCGASCQDLIDKVRAARSALSDVIAVIDRIDEVLDTIPDTLQAVLDDASTSVGAAQLFVDDIGAATVGSASFTAQFESVDVGANVLLGVLFFVVSPAIAPLVEELEVLEIASDLAELSALVPIDTGGIGSMEGDVRGQAEQLAGDLLELTDNYSVSIGGGDYSTALDGFSLVLGDLSFGLGEVQAELDGVQADFIFRTDALKEGAALARDLVGAADSVLAFVEGELICLDTPGCVLEVEFTTAAEYELYLDELMKFSTADLLSFGAGGAFTADLAVLLRAPFDAAVGQLAVAVDLALPSLGLVAGFSLEGALEGALVDVIVNSPAVELMLATVEATFSLLVGDVVGLATTALDEVNRTLTKAVEGAEAALENALAAANSVIDDIAADLPFTTASIDGYAVLASNELDKLHVDAEFSRASDVAEAESVFQGALDITADDTVGDGDSCSAGNSDSRLDAAISALNVPLLLGPATVDIDRVDLGFTLDGSPPSVRGVFGGITTTGGLDFDGFELSDIGFEFGVGVDETYLGATAAARFGSFRLTSAFLLGRTCGLDVIEKLDPQVAEFITLPGGVFNGVYVRGSASFPVIDLGCLLRLSLSADVGAWVLAGPPFTAGGLIGGGGSGKLGCIGALKGQLTLFGEKSGSKTKFAGVGFAAAGVGTGCEPETWTTVQKSRRDTWCGTGDATIKAEYDNGSFSVEKPKVSAVY